jgi:hypothetical protein
MVWVAATAADEAAQAAATDFRWALRWRGGQAWLHLPMPGPATAVAAALALEPALGALEALEAWIGEGLEGVEPCAPGAAPAASTRELPCVHAVASGAEPGDHRGALSAAGPMAEPVADSLGAPLTLSLAAVPGAQLSLPARLLPWGRPAPRGLVQAWPRQQATARLQAYTADQLDPADLHEGALLLLPDAHLLGGLALRLHRPGWPALLARPWPALAGAAVLQPEPAAPATGVVAWLQLSQPLPLPASAWFAEPAVLPGRTGGAVLHGPAGPLAEGELLPLGPCWALRVACLLQPATA